MPNKLDEIDEGWKKPVWKVVKAGPQNHNPLIDDILKPLQRELREVLRLQQKELSNKTRGS